MKNIEYIDELIGKYLAGEASPEEAMLLEDWKNSSPENARHYRAVVKIFEISGGQVFPEVNSSTAWEKIKPVQETKVVSIDSRKIYWRVAASVAILLVFGAVYYYLSGSGKYQNTRYEAQTNASTIQLDDKSGIVIAPHSSIELAQGFGKNNRTVKLKGSAYFNVTHDDDLPFVVDAGNFYIKDIGTKFDVRTSHDTDTVFVRVDEGIVLLFDSLGTEITLTAMQGAIYIRSSGKIIRNLPAAEVLKPLHFDFDETKLGDVIAQLQDGYGVTITLENPALANCAITTSFNGQELETVLGVITETLGLRYTKTTTGYLIKGEQCIR